MKGQQLAVLGVLLLVGVGGVAAPVAGFPATVIAAGTPADQGGSTANNTTMGTQVSSFMQTSAASAEGGVESGMWQAAFENAPPNQRDALVNQRVETLEKRLQKLEKRRAALLEGDTVTTAERAKAARLAARAESLREAINGTERAAEKAGVNTTKLNELRTRARNLTGQEVAQLVPGRGAGKNTQRGPGANAANNRTEDGPGTNAANRTENGPDGEHTPKGSPSNEQADATIMTTGTTAVATPGTATTKTAVPSLSDTTGNTDNVSTDNTSIPITTMSAMD